jgi:hypothetical protein
MAASQDFTLAPAHAHLNLLGWVTLAVMGGFYTLAGPRAPVRLGWINFSLSVLGVIVVIPALVALLSGHKGAEPIVITGTALTILGMLAFAAAVLSMWARPKA